MAIEDGLKQPRWSDFAHAADATRATGVSRRAACPPSGSRPNSRRSSTACSREPEDVFGSPRNIVRGPLVHRTGRSYHLPTGGAVYFDTGVIEIATPMIEIDRGCGARGTRSLWESLGFLRKELDAWEDRHDRERAARRLQHALQRLVRFAGRAWRTVARWSSSRSC